MFSQSQPVDLSSSIVSDQSISESIDMENNGGKNNFNTVHTVTSTPVSTLGQNLNNASSVSEIDSFNLTGQAGILDIQISIDSSSDTSTGLKVLYTNIDSYLNKKEIFQLTIDILDPDSRPGKKLSWFWSSGGSILTKIKKCGPQNKYDTEKKKPSPVFSSPVNHRHPRSSAF